MIVQFVYPTTGQVTGGEAVIYALANALSRHGVDVNFLHGPKTDGRVASLDDIPAVCRADQVVHHLIDALDDPAAPDGDVVFAPNGPSRLGLPATLIQGYRMLSEVWERAAYRSPGPRFCVATWLQEIGLQYGVAPEQLLHLPPGIDHDRFRPTSALEDRPIDVVVLHHPHREKGWPVAEAMLTELRHTRPDARLLVFGRMLDDRIPAGVETIDSPDHRQLAEEIYGRARIFVQTSHNEGFGLTPVEAMACGAALVTTDCGGSRDYGLPGVTADVLPAGDSAGLAAAVGALLDDEPRRLRYAAAGIEHVRRFDWDLSAVGLRRDLERYLSDPEPFLRPPADD